MSLLRGSELRPAMEAAAPSGARWLPSHVQVTVVQARGLRPKGGPGDVFVALQLGRQKHRTSVATGKGGGGGDGPRWGEEVALELPPDDQPDAEALLLQLTVWQRALVGMDRFLGRGTVPLASLLEGGRSHHDRWYKLHSKPGKKEKERGELQVSLQFTRHSLTASMFDLSIKDKPRSPFGKLKDKVKGRRKYDLESASAIVPSSSGALDEDFGLEGKKAKAKVGGFFFKNKLRKSSLTQSNTSLGSDSTLSSASSVVGFGTAETAAPSPSRHGSLSTDRSVRDFFPSPKLTHKRAFSDEVSQINMLPDSKLVQSLKPQDEPISRSSLCINGSHIYCEEPSPKPSFLSPTPAPSQIALGKPEESSGTGPLAPEADLPPWSGSSFQKGPPKDPPRFIPSPPILAAQEEDKLSVKTIALNKHRGRVKMEEGLRAESKPVQIATPMVFSADVVRVRPLEEAQKRAKAGLFRRGSSSKEGGGGGSPGVGSARPPQSTVAAAGEEGSEGGGWFSPKEKPSSQAELLATTEAAKDACFSEDRDSSSFVNVRTLQAEATTQSASPPAAAGDPPSEWDDSFDTFASSRLRPEAGREPPRSPVGLSGGIAHADALGRAGPSEEAADLPFQMEGEPGSLPEGEDPCPLSPGLPHTAPGEVQIGSPGDQASHEPLQSRPGDSVPPWGARSASGTRAEDATRGGPARAERPGECWGQEEPTARELEADAAVAWREGRPASPAGAAGIVLDSTPSPGQAQERAASRQSSSGDVFAAEETPKESSWAEAALGLPSESLTLGAETGQSSSLPGLHGWDVSRQGHGVSLAPPVGGLPTTAMEEAWLSEEASGSSLHPGCSPLETQGEEGARWTMEAPPPKPPRRFTPLSLEEEAGEAVWDTRAPWPGDAAVCEKQAGAVGATCQQGPPAGQESAPLAAAAIMGAGGGSNHLGPRAEAGELVAAANELPSRAVSSGDTVPAVNEGASGAEQFETCPSKLSLGGLGLSSAREAVGPLGDGEPTSPPWMAAGPEELSAQAPPGQPSLQAEAWPSPAAPDPESSPSVVFWTALEEQQLKQPRGSPGLGEETCGLGLGSSGAPASRAPPLAPLPCPQVLASGTLRQGHEASSASESELSSSWSDDRVMDFKKADFWRPERGEHGDAVVMPGNPFAPRPGPAAQNNPFVERLRDTLPAHALDLQAPLVEGLRFVDLHLEVGPRGPPEDQSASPLLQGSQPLAFSTPALETALSLKEFHFPSPIVHPASSAGSAASSPATDRPSRAPLQPSADAAAPLVLPAEPQPAEEVPLQQPASPHLVKPISTPAPELPSEEEKQPRPSLTPAQSDGHEKLQPRFGSSFDSAAPVLQLDKTEAKRVKGDPAVLDPSAKYYHLTHDELIQLLLKREAELGKKQDHVRELENYIDQLLVRIMDQSPTLLQIPLGGESKATH